MGDAAAALEQLLASMDLDDGWLAHAAIARALAAKLDEARESGSGAAAMAISGIAKELRAVIEEIRVAASDQEQFVTDLFS